MTRALVTGGAGFIGSHLVDLLLSNGKEVTVLDDLSTGRRANLAHLDESRYRFVEGSAADPIAVTQAMEDCRTVFHLAALADMPAASGCALGFDRLVMLLLGAPHIGEVQWTPTARLA